LARETIGEAGVAEALAEFDHLWHSLAPREQARLLPLLIKQVDYDGRDDTITLPA